MVLKITNGTCLSGTKAERTNIYIKDGIIENVTKEDLLYDRIIDAEGMYVSPGFIDIHVHGGGGYDFADGTLNDIKKAAFAHALHGTTTIFPTSASMSFEDTLKFIKNVKLAVRENRPGHPFIAGSHLEGPYFAQSMRGAQNPEYIKEPKKEEYTRFIEEGEGSVTRMSFAPELKGAADLCRYLKSKNVVTAYAHTEACYEEIKPVLDLGCRIATHLYSGMETVTRKNGLRRLGGVETAFLEDDIYCEVIADGMHLPVNLLKLIYKLKGSDKICLITDAMRGAGMEDGYSVLGPKNDGVKCIVKNGVAYLEDMQAFAGSVCTSDRLVRVMHKSAEIPLCDCIKMMCENPAKVMGLKDRGKIEKGLRADLVIFDDNINIKKVIIEGGELKPF